MDNEALQQLAADVWALATSGPEEGFGQRLQWIEDRLKTHFVDATNMVRAKALEEAAQVALRWADHRPPEAVADAIRALGES